jgi:TRAP-type C4-dicarboxylate transport system permease small subunit
MIKIDASVQLLPKLKVPLTFFSNFVILIFSVMMIYYGTQMCLLQMRTMQKTIIMQIPYVYPYAVLPLMGSLMLLRVIQVYYEDIKALRTKEN